MKLKVKMCLQKNLVLELKQKTDTAFHTSLYTKLICRCLYLTLSSEGEIFFFLRSGNLFRTITKGHKGSSINDVTVLGGRGL